MYNNMQLKRNDKLSNDNNKENWKICGRSSQVPRKKYYESIISSIDLQV